MLRIALVADDLTGACDSAVPFCGEGRVQVGIWSHLPEGGLACAAVSTESRAQTAEVCYQRTRYAAANLKGDLLFCKIDSTVRGHPARQIAGALDGVGCPHAVVAPALPGEGRVTSDGVQRWPGGEADLNALLHDLAGRIEVRDVVDDGDLDRVAAEVLHRGDRMVVGTAGLAAALARHLALPSPGLVTLRCSSPLAVVGSPAAAEQAAYARSRGWQVQVVGASHAPDLDGHDGLFLTGGETAVRTLSAAGAYALDLIGEAIPRVPVAFLRGGRLDGVPAALKAGGFGSTDAIDVAMEVLHGGPA